MKRNFIQIHKRIIFSSTHFYLLTLGVNAQFSKVYIRFQTFKVPIGTTNGAKVNEFLGISPEHIFAQRRPLISVNKRSPIP